jgi:hypothetical protein
MRSKFYDPQVGDVFPTDKQFVVVHWRNRQWVGFTATSKSPALPVTKMSLFPKAGKIRVGEWRRRLLPFAQGEAA